MRMVPLFHSGAAALTDDGVLAACDGLDQTDDVLPTLGAPIENGAALSLRLHGVKSIWSNHLFM
jgi:hypothetical protein